MGKWSIPLDLDEAIETFGAKPLAISPYHAKMAANLPPHHKDPFDRMIIAQAQAEGLTIISCDAQFANYPVEVISAKNPPS
jgi:PIN domain nuclease of toxin-antitoxin system